MAETPRRGEISCHGFVDIQFCCLIFFTFFNFQVDQRDVPGIDNAFLAMDTEEGVEVVWNEVQFSERKNFKAQEDKIRLVFENLTKLTHPNIVKFHRYWTDTHNDQPRVYSSTSFVIDISFAPLTELIF